MKRLTLTELRDRIDKYICEFGDCPIMEGGDTLDCIVNEDGGYNWVMLIEPNEIPDEDRRQKLIEHGFEYEEHEYLKR